MVEQKLSEILSEDDASRYLDSLSPEERRPRYSANRKVVVRTSFTAEQIELANKVSSPSDD